MLALLQAEFEQFAGSSLLSSALRGLRGHHVELRAGLIDRAARGGALLGGAPLQLNLPQDDPDRAMIQMYINDGPQWCDGRDRLAFTTRCI